MSRFFNKKYINLDPYTPGEQPKDMEYIKLNTNESPFDTPPKASELAALEAYKLRLYSDPEMRDLKDVASRYFGVDKDELIFTNGSDEALYMAVMAFCDEGCGAAFPDITYSFYPVICNMNCVEYEQIPLKDDLTIDIEDYYNLKKTIFIANPNAPTGIALKKSEIEEIVKYNPNNVVIVDEAYVDFGTESSLSLTKKYDNVLVVQTFSKSRGLAGGRLGFAIGNKELIKDLNTLRNSFNPYNVNRMTLAAGIGALMDDEYVEANCAKIIKTRNEMRDELKKLGFKMTDSKANFIFARHPDAKGEYLYKELKNRGILVRHFNSAGIEDYVRITIGTNEQMAALLKELSDIL